MAMVQGELLILSEDASARALSALSDVARKCRAAADALTACGLPGTARIAIPYISIAHRCEEAKAEVLSRLGAWKGGR
jgi:hypothetical protein